MIHAWIVMPVLKPGRTGPWSNILADIVPCRGSTWKESLIIGLW